MFVPSRLFFMSVSVILIPFFFVVTPLIFLQPQHKSGGVDPVSVVPSTMAPCTLFVPSCNKRAGKACTRASVPPSLDLGPRGACTSWRESTMRQPSSSHTLTSEYSAQHASAYPCASPCKTHAHTCALVRIVEHHHVRTYVRAYMHTRTHNTSL